MMYVRHLRKFYFDQGSNHLSLTYLIIYKYSFTSCSQNTLIQCWTLRSPNATAEICRSLGNWGLNQIHLIRLEGECKDTALLRMYILHLEQVPPHSPLHGTPLTGPSNRYHWKCLVCWCEVWHLEVVWWWCDDHQFLLGMCDLWPFECSGGPFHC